MRRISDVDIIGTKPTKVQALKEQNQEPRQTNASNIFKETSV